MPAGDNQLRQFKHAAQDHPDDGRAQPVSGVGKTESTTDQNEGQRMLAVPLDGPLKPQYGWRSQKTSGSREEHRQIRTGSPCSSVAFASRRATPVLSAYLNRWPSP